VKRNMKRANPTKMWEAARFYRKEADKCQKARAYFSGIVARGCELEAILRIFDFVDTRRPKDRCTSLNWLINRALTRHWIPHDALRAWNKTERLPLKSYLHAVREARNGVHAHLFDESLMSRRTMVDITYVVHSVYSFLEIRNARNLMKGLRDCGEISAAEYRAWEKKQLKIM
jgi:hypothetical protein